jgi:hypothetical protein
VAVRRLRNRLAAQVYIPTYSDSFVYIPTYSDSFVVNRTIGVGRGDGPNFRGVRVALGTSTLVSEGFASKTSG